MTGRVHEGQGRGAWHARPQQWRSAALAFGGGVAAGLAQAPLHAPLLLLAGLLALLFALARARSGREAALLAFLAGFGHFLAALEWIRIPFTFEPGLGVLAGPLGVLAWIAMAAGLGLFWAVPVGLLWRFLPRPGPVALAAALALGEFLRGHVLGGFPWALPAYALTETPFAQLAALIGPYGLTAVLLIFAAALLRLRLRGGGLAFAAALAALLVAAWLWGADRAARIGAGAPPGPVIRLVQPAAPQDEKWDPLRVPVFLERMLKATAAPPAAGAAPALVIWPETAIAPLLGRSGAILEAMAAALPQGAELVFGVRRREGRRLYNTMAVMGADGSIRALYDKRRLVPFGEYVPFGDLLGVFGIRGLAAEDGAGFSPGARTGPLRLAVGSAVPLICYEAIFPSEVRRHAGRARFVLQITNDAWFGTRSGPFQHLDQIRFRAIESGLPVVRVANTGVSAVIDAAGRLRAGLPLGRNGFLDAALPAALVPPPYARVGDWPVPLLLLALPVVIAFRRRRQAIAPQGKSR